MRSSFVTVLSRASRRRFSSFVADSCRLDAHDLIDLSSNMVRRTKCPARTHLMSLGCCGHIKFDRAFWPFRQDPLPEQTRSAKEQVRKRKTRQQAGH